MADESDELLESEDSSVPITDRCNTEPAILRGLSYSEAKVAIWFVTPFWLLIGVVVAFATEIWAIAVLVASLGPMLTVWILAGWLARIKRNKPDYYYLHRANFWLAKNGLRKSVLINHYGYWELGREANMRKLKR
jgi:conjugative transfer region protein (TIGR03750 family)